MRPNGADDERRRGTLVVMSSIAAAVIRHDFFLRRRDLLRLGYSDTGIRAALEARQIFRVRHGWYSVPTAPEEAIAAVRVGGRLTGRSALASYGVPVPFPRRRQLVVPARACRLRRPNDRRERLRARDGCDIRWSDAPRTRLDRARAGPLSVWRVTVAEALLDVLSHEHRDVAVSCCDLALNGRLITMTQLRAVFARAPLRVRGWLRLVDGRAAAYGESLVRLWLGDAGIRLTPQVAVRGVGHLDGRISARTFVEVDGAQHADGAEPARAGRRSQFEEDHRRDVVLAVDGKAALRFTYLQLFTDWSTCLAAAQRMVDDDERLARLDALEVRIRKRRRNARERAERRAARQLAPNPPSFSEVRRRRGAAAAGDAVGAATAAAPRAQPAVRSPKTRR